MNRYFIVFCSVLAISCNKKVIKEKPSPIDSAIQKLPDSAYVSLNSSFLDEFKNSGESTFLFNSPKNSIQPMRDTKQVGPEYLPLFPTHLSIGNTKKPEVFAVEKFKIDKNTTALITQNPGAYSLSSLNLMLYDHRAEKISGLLEVADIEDEAGFYSKKQTVLVKDSGKVKGLMWFTTNVRKVDASDPTHPVSTSHYYSVKIKNGKIDTAKATKAEIAKFKSFFK